MGKLEFRMISHHKANTRRRTSCGVILERRIGPLSQRSSSEGIVCVNKCSNYPNTLSVLRWQCSRREWGALRRRALVLKFKQWPLWHCSPLALTIIEYAESVALMLGGGKVFTMTLRSRWQAQCSCLKRIIFLKYTTKLLKTLSVSPFNKRNCILVLPHSVVHSPVIGFGKNRLNLILNFSFFSNFKKEKENRWYGRKSFSIRHPVR